MTDARTTAVVGGGFSGAVFALKLAAARPGERVVLIERGRRVGVGLAYGACGPGHLLNVPVSRMELGLQPRFEDWLRAPALRPDCDLNDALAESAGVLADAFVPRALFGAYVEAQVERAIRTGALQRLRGEVVRLLEPPASGVVLDDGREVAADAVVLATGNLPPARPLVRGGAALAEEPAFVPDPWAPDVFAGLERDDPVLLIGTGLTAVDVALRLAAEGFTGPITAVSRHGALPSRHASGGSWPRFLRDRPPRTAREGLRRVRAELVRAEAGGAPWQRVFDAARPDLARVWSGWPEAERARFLRHLRARWDVRRHRMAPRIAARLDALVAEGRLTVLAGRILGLERAGCGVAATVALRGGGEARLGCAARVVNCTGPRSDFERLETPLYGYLRRRGLIRGDALRLGLETDRCAVLDASGAPSARLFAVGPLTRPALWEVTAVPEINAQIDALVFRFGAEGAPASASSLDLVFADLGAGI